MKQPHNQVKNKYEMKQPQFEATTQPGEKCRKYLMNNTHTLPIQKLSKNKIISTQELVPFFKEILQNGQKVKFTVSGYSMLPWIVHNRDQVLVTGIIGRKLKPGDIIIFEDLRGAYILHRIYWRKADSYCTMGDNCRYTDEPIHTSQIIGVVEKIYRKGREINCDSLLWRFIFLLWRKMLPIRKYLIELYFLLTRIKNNNKSG